MSDSYNVKSFFNGFLGGKWFCAKSDGKFSLFRRTDPEEGPATNSVSGKVVKEDLSLDRKSVV